jgi:cystathionine gamma-synthase
VCTSLTKLVSGRGDAIAGSIVCNPNTEKGRWMQKDLQKEYSETGANDTIRGLFGADSRAILHNSSDFEERNEQINETSEILADWLVQHDDVESVYYPKYAPLYPSLLESNNGGYGGLMSILLQSHMCQRTFYDSLNVAKGPSLGTNFTLVCPYTLLAHYHELDFAMSYNVPPDLLRIAVGMETVDVLKNKFEDAFSKSRLYPKLKRSDDVSKVQSRMFSTYAGSTNRTAVGWNNHLALARRLLRRLPLR